MRKAPSVDGQTGLEPQTHLAFLQTPAYNQATRGVRIEDSATMRTCSVRGKTIEREEFPDVLVMRLPPEAVSTAGDGEPVARWQGRAWELAEEFDVPASTRRRWREAGWHLVRPVDSPPEDELPAPVAVGDVLRNDRGEWMIGTSQLSVRLRDDLDEEEALRSLERNHLRVIRQLKFAPHLYEVQVSEESNSFEKAAELSENHDYVYAEPQLIRHLGKR